MYVHLYSIAVVISAIQPGSWKRRICSDADMDVDTDTRHFKIYFCIYITAVYLAVFSKLEHRSLILPEQWIVSMLQNTIYHQVLCMRSRKLNQSYSNSSGLVSSV